MTDDELDLWIAGKIEPNPRWICGTMTEGEAYTVNPLDDLKLTPRKFSTDAACTTMLIEMMIDEFGPVFFDTIALALRDAAGRMTIQTFRRTVAEIYWLTRLAAPRRPEFADDTATE